MSVSEANETSHSRIVDEALQEAEGQYGDTHQPPDQDEDDDYWAQYDRTPGKLDICRLSPRFSASFLQTVGSGLVSL